ncbi:MAG: VirB4 family type IV secretion system protein [Nitrosotalea sp.]
MKKNRAKTVYTYEVKPTNFFTLPAQKQAVVLSHFYSLLASIQEPLRVTISKEPLKVDMGIDVRHLQILRTFMSSTEPLDGILESQGYDYFFAPNPPKFEVKKEYWKHLLLQNDRVAKCFTLYSPSSSLSPAWVYSLLSACDEIMLQFVPIEQDRAVSKLRKKIHLMRSTQSTNSKIVNQIQMGLQTVSELEKNNTRLFVVTANAIILADDIKSLKDDSKKFVKLTRISLSHFDSTPASQAKMVQGWGKKLYIELGSCDVFYPFVSSDMLEVPNGITIGINYTTGAPIIFNYSMRANYNILILASSGAGKSVTAKLILKRLMEKYPTALTFIVDPEGEYEKIAEYLKIEPIRITEGEELGFDPFRMFEKPSDAVNALCEIAQAPPLVVKSFLSKCARVSSLEEFYGMLTDEERGYVADLVEGPLATLFRGETKISDRTIISLKGTYAEDYVAKVSFLALAKLWKKIGSVPVETPKVLLIDEGHLIFRFASAAKFVDLLARMGRKKNVIFMFISQRVEDVTKTEAGRAFFDNSETKIILRNNEIASDELVRSLQLSPQEKDMVLSFNPGEALILTRDYRLRAYITPSKEELEMFGTSPKNRNES